MVPGLEQHLAPHLGLWRDSEKESGLEPLTEQLTRLELRLAWQLAPLKVLEMGSNLALRKAPQLEQYLARARDSNWGFDLGSDLARWLGFGLARE